MLKQIIILSLAALSWQYNLKSYYPLAKTAGKWTKYMVGEQFFKDGSDKKTELEDYSKDYEYLPYKVLDKNENYEMRHYPSAMYACNKSTNYDTAQDPLAGLENMNFIQVMTSKRYKSRLESKMFWEMFRYIQGVNENQEQIEMTIPVVTAHDIVKEDPLGNYEDITMCFYLPTKYQPDHSHGRQARHESVAPPQPSNDKVFLYTRPPMNVFVRRFGGFAFTHKTWENHMVALEADLTKDNQKFRAGKYYTAGYSSPWTMGERRNEVWMECLEDHHEDTKPSPEVDEQ